MVLFTVVLWAHIFSAIGWLGAAMVFGIIIGPSLAKLSPQARGEFMVKVMPRYLRYFEVFSAMTIIFGVITAAVLLNGDFSSISFSTPFGLYITIGAILALIVFAVSFSVILPIDPQDNQDQRVDDEDSRAPSRGVDGASQEAKGHHDSNVVGDGPRHDLMVAGADALGGGREARRS